MPITAAILCGGRGTRLQPVIGPDIPKCMAPVAGRPFLEYVLDHLLSQGIQKAVLCCGWKVAVIANHFVRDYRGILLEYSIENPLKPKGTAGALKHALSLLDSDLILVLNGATFCKFDLKDLLEYERIYWKYPTSVVTMYSGSIAAGVWLISKRFIKGPLEPLQRLLNNQGVAIPGVVYGKGISFLDIGTPEGYALAEGFLRSQGVIK